MRSATDRSSIGTIILLRLKHIDQCLSHSDQTNRSDVIREKKLKLRIVPIAIDMCQVPPIDSQQAPSPSRGRNTSISASPIPIRPAVRIPTSTHPRSLRAHSLESRLSTFRRRTMGPQPDLARHQRFRRLVAIGVKCISNYSELSTYHEYGNIFFDIMYSFRVTRAFVSEL